jgi:hypothetical protein
LEALRDYRAGEQPNYNYATANEELHLSKSEEVLVKEE